MKKLLSLVLAFVMVVGVMAPVKVNAMKGVSEGQEVFNTLRTAFADANTDEVLAVMAVVFSKDGSLYKGLKSDVEIKTYLDSKGITDETISTISGIMKDNMELMSEIIAKPELSYSDVSVRLNELFENIYKSLPETVIASIQKDAPTREDRLNIVANVLKSLLGKSIGTGEYKSNTNNWVKFDFDVTKQMKVANQQIKNSPLKDIHTKILNNLLDNALNDLTKPMKDMAGDMLLASKIITKVESGKTFKDIVGHWSKTFVDYLAARNIVSGYGNDTFKPNGEITRAEFSRIIVSALELDIVKYDGKFKDVKAKSWYADYVATMTKAGFVVGYDDGTFKPDNKITRAEMAQMLSKAIDGEVNPADTDALLSQFKDVKTIKPWSKAAIAEVAEAKIMIGDTNKNFNPVNTATRAEAATAIYKLYIK